ncbi:hypothetical protein O6H91_10G003600 [Diphasiastrum complanatum]|uniref:Uncharacterized protein n=2 Tax=Diphasiastrum complanatum TaxID=34168 RepID=A0ACC2CES7_DIPCM|nr:hypothetical protein O6H91_10G002500 [Diphasiastrum complanatum]KAJ7540167.1 hypothetical protein O6H91_10G003600 [Diphasiastrum complanatum]
MAVVAPCSQAPLLLYISKPSSFAHSSSSFICNFTIPFKLSYNSSPISAWFCIKPGWALQQSKVSKRRGSISKSASVAHSSSSFICNSTIPFKLFYNSSPISACLCIKPGGSLQQSKMSKRRGALSFNSLRVSISQVSLTHEFHSAHPRLLLELHLQPSTNRYNNESRKWRIMTSEWSKAEGEDSSQEIDDGRVVQIKSIHDYTWFSDKDKDGAELQTTASSYCKPFPLDPFPLSFFQPTQQVETCQQELEHTKDELARAHTQVPLSDARVEDSLHRPADMESFDSERLLQLGCPLENYLKPAIGLEGRYPQAQQLANSLAAQTKNKSLVVSGPIGSYSAHLKNFWYPVAFSKSIDTEIALPIESFEKKWVIFRDKDGKAGCIRDACAHRACPLSLGKVVDGCIQCPYHGWEYSTTGICEKIPSTKQINASVKSIPCIEKDGLVWIWPGINTPESTLPAALSPPEGYSIHAEIALEVDVEHSLLLENLLDLVHAPFTHTTTFAKGWPVYSSVQFKTPMDALKGFWDPYPIDMEFRPPCMVLSTVGISLPGQLKGKSISDSKTHLHQLHVLAEDLRLVEGQQDRMIRGENAWNLPVAYDKLGIRYRRWRIAVEDSNNQHQRPR